MTTDEGSVVVRRIVKKRPTHLTAGAVPIREPPSPSPIPSPTHTATSHTTAPVSSRERDARSLSSAHEVAELKWVPVPSTGTAFVRATSPESAAAVRGSLERHKSKVGTSSPTVPSATTPTDLKKAKKKRTPSPRPASPASRPGQPSRSSVSPVKSKLRSQPLAPSAATKDERSRLDTASSTGQVPGTMPSERQRVSSRPSRAATQPVRRFGERYPDEECIGGGHCMELPTETVEERIAYLNQMDEERLGKLRLQALAEQGIARRPDTLIRTKYGPIKALVCGSGGGPKALMPSAAPSSRASSAAPLSITFPKTASPVQQAPVRSQSAAPKATRTSTPVRPSGGSEIMKIEKD